MKATLKHIEGNKHIFESDEDAVQIIVYTFKEAQKGIEEVNKAQIGDKIEIGFKSLKEEEPTPEPRDKTLDEANRKIQEGLKEQSSPPSGSSSSSFSKTEEESSSSSSE